MLLAAATAELALRMAAWLIAFASQRAVLPCSSRTTYLRFLSCAVMLVVCAKLKHTGPLFANLSKYNLIHLTCGLHCG